MPSTWISTHCDDHSFMFDMPKAPGVYCIYFAEPKTDILKIKYIGSTTNLKARLTQHKLTNWARYSQIIRTAFGETHSILIKYKVAADNFGSWLPLERNLIRRIRPVFNKMAYKRNK